MTQPLKSGVPANSAARPLINDIFDFSAEALGQVRTWLEQNPPAIPVTQIIGFNQFTAQAARVSGTTTTTGDTLYHDFTTPLSLTGLPDGQYVFLFGASLVSVATNSQQGVISLGINGTATDTDGIQQQLAIGSSLAGASIRSLSSGGNNTVKLQQRVTTSSYSLSTTSPWIVGLKFANA